MSARPNFQGSPVATEGRKRSGPFRRRGRILRTTRLLRPVALTSSENRRRRNGTRLRTRFRCRRCAPRRVPRDPGAASLGRTRCRNIGRLPFRRAPADGHSSGRAPSTWERLTRSRSPIDRKPSPRRPSGFHRSSSYCHHDKHTRPLQPSSRTTFRADRVAPLPVDACVAPPIQGVRRTPSRRRTIGRPIKRHPFSGLHDSTGELLHTPQMMSTSMTTSRLSPSHNALSGVLFSVAGHLTSAGG